MRSRINNRKQNRRRDTFIMALLGLLGLLRLPTGASIESTDFPDRFSETWDQSGSSRCDAASSRDQQRPASRLRRLRRRLPCNRCWTPLIASAAITTFVVGGVLLIVAFLVRHHDDQIEKLEQSILSPTDVPDFITLAGTRKDESMTRMQLDNENFLQPASFCISQPCLNGGTCLTGSNFAQCICEVGYAGQFCDEARNESSIVSVTTSQLVTTTSRFCGGRECLNGGVCSAEIRRCRCPADFEGRYCQNPSKGVCASSPCAYSTPCSEVDSGADFHCTCGPGLAGKRCENITCGSNGTLIASESNEMISSPDYPNDELAPTNCSWSIAAKFYFVTFSVEDIYLTGESCNDSSVYVYDSATWTLINRYCPFNASQTVFQTRGSRLVSIRYIAQAGSYFRLTYSSPDIDPCTYFNNASCTHGKCWPEDTKATCVCDACYRGIGCSQLDEGDCTPTYCANGGTCSYNCYLQVKRCHCAKGYDPVTNCTRKCTETGGC